MATDQLKSLFEQLKEDPTIDLPGDFESQIEQNTELHTEWKSIAPEIQTQRNIDAALRKSFSKLKSEIKVAKLSPGFHSTLLKKAEASRFSSGSSSFGSKALWIGLPVAALLLGGLFFNIMVMNVTDVNTTETLAMLNEEPVEKSSRVIESEIPEHPESSETQSKDLPVPETRAKSTSASKKMQAAAKSEPSKTQLPSAAGTESETLAAEKTLEGDFQIPQVASIAPKADESKTEIEKLFAELKKNPTNALIRAKLKKLLTANNDEAGLKRLAEIKP